MNNRTKSIIDLAVQPLNQKIHEHIKTRIEVAEALAELESSPDRFYKGQLRSDFARGIETNRNALRNIDQQIQVAENQKEKLVQQIKENEEVNMSMRDLELEGKIRARETLKEEMALLEKLKKDNEFLSNQLERYGILNSDLNQKNAKLNEELEEIKFLKTTLETVGNQLAAERDQLSKENVKLSSELKSTSDSLQEVSSKLQEETVKYQTTVFGMGQQIRGLKQEIQALQNELDQFNEPKRNTQKLHDEVSELQSKLEYSRKVINSLNEKLSNIKKENEEIKMQPRNEANDNKKSELLDILSRQKDTILNLSNVLKQRTTELHRYQQSLLNSNSKLTFYFGVDDLLPIKLTRGFSGGEASHRWTEGKNGTIFVPVDYNDQRIRQIIFDTNALVSKEINQRLILTSSWFEPKTYEFSLANRSNQIIIDIPDDAEGELEINFEVPTACLAREVDPLNNDDRLLGILFTNAHLYLTKKHEAKHEQSEEPSSSENSKQMRDKIKELELLVAQMEAERVHSVSDRLNIIFNAINGNREAVEHLIALGEDIHSRDSNGFTPLAHSLLNSHQKIAEFLIKQGADIESRSNNHHNILDNLVIRLNLEMTKFLLGHLSKEGLFPKLMIAYIKLSENKHEDIDKLAEMKDFLEKEMLFLAVKQGNREQTNKILHLLSNINIQDEYGNTALHNACYYGHTELVHLLLDEGLSIDDLNDKGETAYQISSNDDIRLLITHYAILRAVEDGNAEKLDDLIEDELDLNAVSNLEGTSPLSIAVSLNRLNIVEKLVQHGADVNLANYRGEKPLEVAAKTGNKPLAKLLLNSKAGKDKEEISKIAATAREAGHQELADYIPVKYGKVKMLSKLSASVSVVGQFGRDHQQPANGISQAYDQSQDTKVFKANK